MMPALRNLLSRLGFRLDSVSLRQRLLMLGTGVMLLVLVIDYTALRPLEREQTQTLQQIRLVSGELVALDRRVSQESRTRSGQEQARISGIQRDIVVRDQALTELRRRLISPAQADQMLQGLVSADPRLALLQLESIPPTPLGTGDGAQQALWQHGLRLALRADYFAIRDYLKALESSDWPIYWESLQLQSDGTGPVTANLTLSTLSEAAPWLQLQ